MGKHKKSKREMSKSAFVDRLSAMGACSEAMEWVEESAGTPRALWESCERGDWLLWLCCEARLGERVLRHLAADFALQAARYATDDEACAIAWCVDVARRRADGATDDEEISAAASAAEDAAWGAVSSAAESAVESAASSAAEDAAEDAAWVAVSSAVSSAAWVAWWSTPTRRERGAAESAAWKRHASLVRARISWAEIEKAMARR